MRKAIVGAVLALAVGALFVVGAGAGKPPSSSSMGLGSVFAPNPVQTLGDESLTDQKDADAAVPAAAYRQVTLTNLDGSGFLSGILSRRTIHHPDDARE